MKNRGRDFLTKSDVRRANNQAILYTPIGYISTRLMSQAIVNRLKRIEGQVRGITQMLEQDRYCVDILYQIAAIKAALGKVEGEVLKAHAASCVDEAIRSGSAAEQRRKFDELVELFARVKR